MAFDPQNKLERLLMAAAKDPARRPEFYRAFVESDIFFIEHGNQTMRAGRRTLEQGYQLRIQPAMIDGKSYLPIFSSLPRLQAVLKHEAGYVAMNALKFLEITRGADLYLNSGSDFCKEFTAAEIASILDGSIWKPAEETVIKKGTQVVIGPPAKSPGELIAALRRYFDTHASVRRAWVALFFDPARGGKPHTILALEVTGDWDQIFGETGMIARSVSIPDPPVDLIRVTGRGALDDYFLKSTEPFYKKRFLGIF